ncbi:uncharacterized protein LOC110462125 [Mizuhopecten yessoensis]|uniref:uncharacterized protein LOC110462125 n=1 Tax=Mizuhopecten yessoensis TaxID=6573 RepID=UPI000B45900E|nr:uncharacterized protein LOC110462125 [Mizuhopecten yessoensis]
MAAQTPVPGCPRHPGMGFVYVCKSCEDQLLCMECVTDSHNGHTLDKLTDYVAGQKQEIQQFADKLSKTDIPNTEGDIKECGQQTKTHGGRYQKMIEDIKRQGKQMKDDIDSGIDLLVRMCTELEERNACISEKNKSTLTKYLREDLKPNLERCQEVLTSGTTVDVTTLAREIRNGVSTGPPSLSDLQNVEYKPGTISTELLERMLGKLLVDGVDESYKPIPKCELLYEFQTSFVYSNCNTCLNGDEAWLSHWTDYTIHRVDVKGKVNEEIDCQVKVQSMSVSPTTGRVWLCVVDDRSIREITTGGDIVTRFNVENTPGSLCITSDDMVVVGMKGGIQLYTTDGRAVSAGMGGPCRQAAVVPHHMTSCTLTGDVAAVDNDGVSFDDYMAGKNPGKQPSVIVMDKHLNLKFCCKDIGTRKTHGSDIQSSKFHPHDVCFDGAGDVLVMDYVTKSVLLIDRNTGHYMRTVYTSDRSKPMCICLRDDGTLWVGHGNKSTKVIKYK